MDKIEEALTYAQILELTIKYVIPLLYFLYGVFRRKWYAIVFSTIWIAFVLLFFSQLAFVTTGEKITLLMANVSTRAFMGIVGIFLLFSSLFLMSRSIKERPQANMGETLLGLLISLMVFLMAAFSLFVAAIGDPSLQLKEVREKFLQQTDAMNENRSR